MEQLFRNRKTRLIERTTSQKIIDIKGDTRGSRNVKFSEKIIQQEGDERKKHRSASILKKRDKSAQIKFRSDSANSMASQGPLDDQSCENSNLNKIMKEEYFDILEGAKKKGKFCDPLFPPVMSSIFSYSGRKINKHPNIKWMRIPDLFPNKKIAVFNHSESKIYIKPSSSLSAQFFPMALNAIKNNRAILKKMFQDQKYIQFGVYYVKIFQGNVWKYTIIDDLIPVIIQPNSEGKQSIQPLFISIDHQLTSSQDPVQIWPYLLEKALAKYYSNYQALQFGNIFDFLEQLTNRTFEQHDTEKKKAFLKQIFSNPEVILIGQTKQHVKTSIDILQNNKNLLQVSFTLNKIKHLIEIEQIPKYLARLYVISQRVYNYIGHCPIRQIKQSISLRQFTLKTSSFCSMTLNQKDKKFFHQPTKYLYAWVRIIIVQKQFNGTYRWIDGRYDNQKTMTIETELQAGDYYVIIMPQWTQRSYDLTLILRSSKMPIRLERKIYQEGIIEQACADLAQRYGKLNQLNTYICSYNCIHQEMGLIIENINNERMKGQIKIVRSIQGLKSKVEIQSVNKEFQKSQSIQVIIKNNSHFTVVLKMKGGVDRQFFKTFDFGSK